MLKKDELAGPSCLTKAADDEPIFVLRAQDLSAPFIVRLWADAMAHRTGADKNAPGKVNEAYVLAAKMELWQERTGKGKWPD